MSQIVLTASIVKKDKGCYVARADELSVVGEPASTQRGAITKLKSAVSPRLRAAAENGRLSDILDNAGYSAERLGFGKYTLQSFNFNQDTVTLPVTRPLITLDRRKRQAIGEGEID